MKAASLAVLVLVATAASAEPFFTGNPWSPIPPGCVTRPDLQQTLYGANEVVVFDGETEMIPATSLYDGGAAAPAATPLVGDLRITRQLCAEPNGSALIVSFGIPESMQSSNQAHYLRPGFWADNANGGLVGWFTPVTEPSTAIAGRVPDRLGQPVFGDFADGWEYLGHVKWTYLLDLAGPLEGYKPYAEQAAQAYNGRLDLSSDLQTWDEPAVPWRIPATAAVGPAPTSMPLTGRHSGTWVIEGARDQGITLSSSNRLPPAAEVAGSPEWAPLYLFLTWYTFDTEGRGLWLTGSGELPQGAREVTMPIVRVNAGEFLGDTPAERSVVGPARIVANGCNDLSYEYDLSALGLGTGSRRLQRLYSLETAGYDCRDYAAKVAANR